jgi:ADP-ribosylglycohydrolase
MRAAIAGDIIGSRFERSLWQGAAFADAWCAGYDVPKPRTDCRGEKAATFALFHPACHVTDDTVLTLAVMEWLLDGGDLATLFRQHYQHCGRPELFGRYFVAWARPDAEQPCGSVGNGAAMRVSPVSFVAEDVATVLRLAEETAVVTHQVEHAIDGARAMALGVFLARTGRSKEEIRHEISTRFHYDIDTPLDRIRPGYSFTSACAETVPLAYRAFFEADDFEGTVRRAISVGGDADTIASMAGGIAGACWGLPPEVGARVLTYLDLEQRALVQRFEERYPAARHHIL